MPMPPLVVTECGYDVTAFNSVYVIVMLTSGLVVTYVTPTRVTDQPSHHQCFNRSRSLFHLTLLAGDVISLLTTMTAAFMTSSTSSYPPTCQSILTSSAYRLVYVPLIVIYSAALLLVELTGHFRSAVFHPCLTSIFLASPPWVFAAILVFSPTEDFCVASQDYSIPDTDGVCPLLTVAFCLMAVSLNHSLNSSSVLGANSKSSLIVVDEKSEITEALWKDFSPELKLAISDLALLSTQKLSGSDTSSRSTVGIKQNLDANGLYTSSAVLRRKDVYAIESYSKSRPSTFKSSIFFAYFRPIRAKVCKKYT